MERKTLGLILAIIPLIAVIGALVIAFALTGDVKTMVLETGPEEVISGYLTGFTGAAGDMFTVSGYSLSDDRETLLLKVMVSNPIDYPLIISSMSYMSEFNGKPVTIKLDSPVEVMPESTAEIILTGDLASPGQLTGIPKMPNEPNPSDINSEISFAGIILKNNGGVQ